MKKTNHNTLLSRLIPRTLRKEFNLINGSFSEALAQAEKQDKLIFLDCYTTWCGPCKWMAAKVFTQEEVAKNFNKNFICVAFDMEKGRRA
jgi:thiol:disulfide interchange protein